MSQAVNCYRIGDFELNVDKSELHHRGQRVALEPKAYSVLAYLVAHRQRTVPQDELVEQVWPGRVISSDAMYRAIKLARLAFSDRGVDESIKTVHRVGYRFVLLVDNTDGADFGGGFLPLLALRTSPKDFEPPNETRLVASAEDLVVIACRTTAVALTFALSLQRTADGMLPGMAMLIGETQDEEGNLSDRTIEFAQALARLAAPAQILLSAAAYELVRAYPNVDNPADMRWLAHGAYRFSALGETSVLFEVGHVDAAPLRAPADGDVAIRATGDDAIVGWRAAAGQSIPGRDQWSLKDYLGGGGFGEAWLAEHDRTHEQRVFKFCYREDRLRSLQREVTLFRVLREALGARADIARILDWNFDRAPYFIESEFTVAGDLVSWASEQDGLQNVPLQTRIDLIAGVARALAAAHEVGVLHKDVKPGNILIDNAAADSPHAVLADFGIGTLTNTDPLTRHGITALGMTEALKGNVTTSRSGTRAYQAPEVLEGKPATIQADIYSLGIVAYQVIVGDMDRVLATGWERDIDDDLLRSDIAAMVDRDPEKRPRDARQVADNLSRLAQRRAQRKTDLDALQRERSARRRRQFLMPLGAALIVFSVAMTWQNTRVNRALSAAEQEAATSQATADFLSGLFDSANPLFRGAEPPELQAVLGEAEKRIQTELSDQPAVRAQLLTTMGRAFGALGDQQRGRKLLITALEASRQSRAPLLAARAQVELGILLNQAGDSAAAEKVLGSALQEVEALPREAETDLVEASLRGRLARSFYLQGRNDEAIAQVRLAVTLQQTWLPSDDPGVLFYELMAVSYGIESEAPGDDDTDATFQRIIASLREKSPEHYALFFAYFNYAYYLELHGQREAGEVAARSAVTLAKDRFGDQHPWTASALYRLGAAHVGLDRYEDAEATMQQALAIREAVLGDHLDTFSSLSDLADLYRIAGDPMRALEMFRRALLMGERALGEDHFAMPGTRHRYGQTLAELGRDEEAEAEMATACAQSADLLGEDHWRTHHCISDWAVVRARLGDASALKLSRDAVALLQTSMDEDNWVFINARANLAATLMHAGEHEEARQMFEQSLPLVDASPGQRRAWEEAYDAALVATSPK